MSKGSLRCGCHVDRSEPIDRLNCLFRLAHLVRPVNGVGLVALVLSLVLSASAAWAQDLDEIDLILDFELVPLNDRPGGWGGGPAETQFADFTWFWSGHASGRLQRTSDSPQQFSTYTYALPADFVGNEIVYRGYLRSDAVDGWAGLWMRIDGDAGAIAFDNMQQRAVSGSTDWTLHEIRLPLSKDAKQIYFGALLAGTGSLWVDGLQIEVDGVAIQKAERIQPDPTALDRDHEFDDGSGIELNALGAGQLENLVLLGRIWGFLKYHHPLLVTGQRHWDYELFRVLPSLLRETQAAGRQAILVDWISSLGEIDACVECASFYEDLYMDADLDWIQDEDLLGTELAAMLDEIYRNRPVVEEQFYVGQAPQVGNPVFRNEPSYEQHPYPDTGYRILALYRLWNIIEYWFPYRDVIGEDWTAVLEQFLPRLVAAPDGDAYRLEMMQLIARVNDTHANLWSDLALRPPAGECGLDVSLRFMGDRCVVSGFADDAAAAASPLQPGDEILTLDRKPVAEWVREYAPYYAASNQPTRLRDMARQLMHGDCGEFSLGIRRGDEQLELVLERVPVSQRGPTWHDRPGEAFQMLGDEIAYLKFSSVEVAAVPSYLEQAEDTKGWILDLRNYPSEFVVFALGQHLVETPTEFVRFTVSDLESPGAFYWADPMLLAPAPPHYAGQLVILVDETTQSSAEYTSMAFRAVPGAIVVGSTTAGADGNVSRIPLPGGLSTMISGIGVFYPDRRPTQRVGIEVDVERIPTVDGIRAGRDEVLEEAVRRIMGDELSDLEIQELLQL